MDRLQEEKLVEYCKDKSCWIFTRSLSFQKMCDQGSEGATWCCPLWNKAVPSCATHKSVSQGSCPDSQAMVQVFLKSVGSLLSLERLRKDLTAVCTKAGWRTMTLWGRFHPASTHMSSCTTWNWAWGSSHPAAGLGRGPPRLKFPFCKTLVIALDAHDLPVHHRMMGFLTELCDHTLECKNSALA